MLALATVPARAWRQVDQGPGAAHPPGLPASVEQIRIAGVENAFRISPALFSGGQPEGAASFAALRTLGVKTILSVDGSRPDAEAARAAGLRYVHLPVGYDGIPGDQALKIVQAASTLPGPVFIHCHHGKHRGPAAVALCGMALGGWTPDQAVAWLTLAGTSRDYAGLYETVRRFRPPAPEALRRVPPSWPERATVTALAEAMVEIDQRWDVLKAYRAGGHDRPANSPEFDPLHEALQLRESFREAGRLDEARERGAQFLEALRRAEGLAGELENSLRGLRKGTTPESRAKVDAVLTRIGKDCVSCHARFRDRPLEAVEPLRPGDTRR
jgi:protein tyrosine phosphatase (PTP) superfamily phosphohydrolase (DUF442 family)